MNYLLVLLFLIQSATISPPPVVRTYDTIDAESCQKLGQIADNIQPELPKMVDKITRVDGVSVICSLKTFSYNKFLNVELKKFREGWLARKQGQWDQVNCENEAFKPLIDRGWRFVQNFTFLSGERFAIVAKCDS